MIQEMPYHYTNFDNLKGILESRQLWLTNIACFEDTEEFIYPCHRERMGHIGQAARNDIIQRCNVKDKLADYETLTNKVLSSLP